MDFLDFFMIEDFISLGIDIVLFLLLVRVYLRVRSIARVSSEVWVQQLFSFLKMVLAAILLPVIASALSFIILEDASENYEDIMFIVSFYPPAIAALVRLSQLAGSAKQNA